MGIRRLAAIIAIDVVGYSAMMAADEEGTHAALKAHRNATDPVVTNHGGRVVKTTGDGMLVEVPSAVEAVRAAVETQQMMARRNAELPAERSMEYRIGINLGDILIDDDQDVYGDDVNVAARLEGLADPGGILISEVVHRQVVGHVDTSFDYRGSKRLKNIPEPVRVWAVLPEGATTSLARPFSPDTTVAVLPFTNLSADPEQEYFADGVTDDLITALSHDPDLQVVARNSVFFYKDRPTDVRTVGRELDARYVVEGSVRRAGQRLRIVAQLVEAESGHHLWADTYDRRLSDVFEIQDEIAHEINTRVGPTLRTVEGHQRGLRSPDELGAWELLQRARWHADRHTFPDLQAAVDLAEQSISLAPSATAHAELSGWWIAVAMQGWHMDGRSSWEEIEHHARRAHELDATHPYANSAMSWAAAYRGDFSDAIGYARRATDLNPHVPLVWTSLGHALYFDGQHDESVTATTEAWRLGRHEPWRWHIATILAYAHYLGRGYEASLAWAGKALAIASYVQAHTVAAAAAAQLGRREQAERHISRVLEEHPGLTAARYRRSFLWRNPKDSEHLLEGLVNAGLEP